MRLKRVMFWVVVIVSGIIILFLSNEWNRAAFGVRDSIEDGTKFGLTIGDNKQEVIGYLTARGLTDVSTYAINETHYNPQRCHNHTYSDEHEVELWSDDSWRRGTICVAFLDGKLARMSWNYGMFQP